MRFDEKEDMSAQPPPYLKAVDGYGVGAGKPMMMASPASAAEKDLPARPTTFEASSSYSQAPATSQHIKLQTRFADISGTYYVSPHTVATPPATGRRRRRKQKRKQLVPDAVFRSRRGNLALDLGTTGYASENAAASIAASTRSGNISMNLIAGAAVRPRFDVEISTRSGNVVLFIPPTFSGAIQLHTKRGEMQFLPGITSEMRVVKATETEYLVFVGAQHIGGEQTPADFCRLRTRRGNIMVGIRGKDLYVKPSGLWERITGFLRR
uniref:DUF7330 domain-containing protein n=1 Tax=Mycena chlorophos TaxID=658473 RepID=A0ABQ0L3G9_MYCCL|nr:predicted protein [Mycena chlorophos]